MKRIIILDAALAAVLVGGLFVSGCVSPQSGTNFSRSEAIRAQQTHYGVIEAVQEGKIDGTKSGVGTVAGGVLGGFAGRTVGGGSGKNLATAGGAIAGAVAGSMAEEKLTQQKAYSLTVKLDDGRLLTIVQNASQPFTVGQRVKLLETDAGRWRVQTL